MRSAISAGVEEHEVELVGEADRIAGGPVAPVAADDDRDVRLLEALGHVDRAADASESAVARWPGRARTSR